MEPLFLDSPMHEKIWGGNRLKTEFGYDIPSEHTGEYWAISAHPNGVSYVKNGKYAGFHLAELYKDKPELFGHPKASVFPLLTKILDANDWLSVQVHPDDAYGMEHEGELGKTECWYIIDAEEGAEIIYGHKAQTKEELAALIEAGDWDGLLSKTPVKKGDFFFVPSGTMHAIGPGILILETQQSSDTTYRVYAKGADGKVLSVVATTSDGVMSFTVPAMSYVIVTTEVLATSGTASTGTTTPTTPGSTTNPGTGANDVVGVAAALAVVALVSGAAISLKK